MSIPIGSSPQLLTPDRQVLREGLIEEEFQEYRDAVKVEDLVEAVDGLIDLLYVTYGALVEHGVNADKCFAEVQRSNMTKLDGDGKPIWREDGKLLKGPFFESPNLIDILTRKERR